MHKSEIECGKGGWMWRRGGWLVPDGNGGREKEGNGVRVMYKWGVIDYLQHLLVHKTHKTIELTISQTTPFFIELIYMHGDTSLAYRPLVYNAKLTFSILLLVVHS